MDAEREIVPLLQRLIRNACVNDGSVATGHESRNADALETVLAGPGLDLERHERASGRGNLVARITGSDPTAPSLCLLGHTDVVPVNEDRWRRDPFGGELVDGEVWGRGAIDMLNLTASMALAMRTLADQGFRPRGDLVFAAVADEEAGGEAGARFLVDEHPDLIAADYAITEAGGMPLPTPVGQTALPVLVAERGLIWPTLTVRGTAGHGSLPFGADNALVKAAEVVRRLAAYPTPVHITPEWSTFVTGLGFPEPLASALTSSTGVDEAITMLPAGMAKVAHSSTRTTIAPTGLTCTSKTNVIPDSVQIRLDVRTLPGDDAESVRVMLHEAVGDLCADVHICIDDEIAATRSRTDTPLWESMQRVAGDFYPNAKLLPMLMVGGTDNRFLRGAGAVGYGFGLYSRNISLEDLAAMGHGDNERIDVDSLSLVTRMWPALIRDFLG
jgi:acetylornithine deacetylase/succinyl-diaminopimelate desuccinylase-like protein